MGKRLSSPETGPESAGEQRPPDDPPDPPADLAAHAGHLTTSRVVSAPDLADDAAPNQSVDGSVVGGHDLDSRGIDVASIDPESYPDLANPVRRDVDRGRVDSHDTRSDREFRAEQEDEFLEPMDTLSRPTEPFGPPEEIVDQVNPDYEYADAYQSNCADCARCFERGWRGHVEVAAGRAYEPDPVRVGYRVDGEPTETTEEWAGRPMTDLAQPGDLRSALDRGGPGSSAVVHTWYRDEGKAGGHAYNVVNDRGTIRTVDAQSGEVFDFDDASIHPQLSADSESRVMAWNSIGEVLDV